MEKDVPKPTLTGASTEHSREPYAKVNPKLWAIHGQYYDLTSFIERHPGGSEMLLLGRGRDCTEMFESIHSLSKINVHKLLEKYRVETPEEAPEELFSWEENGFYATVRKRVRAHFEAVDPKGNNYKATWAYWVKVVLLLTVWILAVRSALFTTTSTLQTVVSAFIGGIVMNMIGFCVMHDASHYAISKVVLINRVLHTLWSDWNLWSHFIWLRHHVYGHHSYTAVFKRDPDIHNIMNIVRKHPRNRYRKHFSNNRGFGIFLLTMFPNQHIGQSYLYIKSWIAKHILVVPLEKYYKTDIIVSWCIYVPSIICHFVIPYYMLPFWVAFAGVISYWTAQGLGYFTTGGSLLSTGKKRGKKIRPGMHWNALKP